MGQRGAVIAIAVFFALLILSSQHQLPTGYAVQVAPAVPGFISTIQSFFSAIVDRLSATGMADAPPPSSCTDMTNCACGMECRTGACVPVINTNCELGGDIDNDGTVSCGDVNCVLAISSSLPIPPECTAPRCADVAPIGSPNGVVDIADAVVILRLASIQNGYTCDQNGDGNRDDADPPGHPSNSRACVVRQCYDFLDNDADGLPDRFLDKMDCIDYFDNSEGQATPQCSDGIDNDHDGLTDYNDPRNRRSHGDPGCDSLTDDDEVGQCQDGLDNDGDGFVDYPADHGCSNAADNDERDPVVECNDHLDNDRDGLIDYPLDPDCAHLLDTTEHPIFQCQDGLDNDGDGRTDYPNDPQCLSITDESEAPECNDHLDDDGDGKIDLQDRNCANAADDTERPECSDRVDNDGRGDVDYPADPDCRSLQDNTERNLEECRDGWDNDGDGGVDYANDHQCKSWTDDSEYPDCDDGEDNDGDGLTDSLDPYCLTPDRESESPQCSDGIDNDGDGLTDYSVDPDCSDADDNNERSLAECRDGSDNDNDGGVDSRDVGFSNWDHECSNRDDDTEIAECADWRDNDRDGKRDMADDGCDDPNDNSEKFQCRDGLDNDADGRVDYPTDTDCRSYDDNTEGPPQCRDGRDNDQDGKYDYDPRPAHPWWDRDLGCSDANDDGEVAECADGIDNDGDGAIDLNDAQCMDMEDNSEAPECRDGKDNDWDGYQDASDPGCDGGPTDDSEHSDALVCDNGRDDDTDGMPDYACRSYSGENCRDPGCSSPTDTDEHSAIACDNGGDDDGDGKIDYCPWESCDTGCESATDSSEAGGQCDNNFDDDHDGAIDLLDPGCSGATDTSEDNLFGPQCDDGLDNDRDSKTDYRVDGIGDPDCTSNAGTQETGPSNQQNVGLCSDRVNNDFDPWIDRDDPGCYDPYGTYHPEWPEHIGTQCDDWVDDNNDGHADRLIDNNGNHLADWGYEGYNDPGCTSVWDPSEGGGSGLTQCNDGVNNDWLEDTLIDCNDPGCVHTGVCDPNDNDERNEAQPPGDTGGGDTGGGDTCTECGGPPECPRCEVGDPCTEGSDCLSGACDTDGTCKGSCDMGGSGFAPEGIGDLPTIPGDVQKPDDGSLKNIGGMAGEPPLECPNDGVACADNAQCASGLCYLGLCVRHCDTTKGCQRAMDSNQVICYRDPQRPNVAEYRFCATKCTAANVGSVCPIAIRWCHPQGGVCQRKQCDISSSAHMFAESILQKSSTNPNDPNPLVVAIYNSFSSIPGTDYGQNLIDVMNGMCPLTERHVYTGTLCDGSSDGPTRAAEQFPFSTVPQMNAQLYLERSLRGLNNLLSLPEYLRKLKITSLYGENHDCPDHREYLAFDVRQVQRGPLMPPEDSELHAVDQSTSGRYYFSDDELCDIAQQIKALALLDPLTILPTGYMNVPYRIRNAPACAADIASRVLRPRSDHNNHLHVAFCPDGTSTCD